MKEIALYHRASAGGIKVWILRMEADRLTTRWGIYGGRMQETSDLMKPKGKVGTKAFKSATLVATEEFDRKVKKKKDEGYVEDLKDVRDSVSADFTIEEANGADWPHDAALKAMTPTQQFKEVMETAQRAGYPFTQRVPSGLDFNNPPREFAPSKPVSSIEMDEALHLEQQGKLTIQRKSDGLRTFIFKGSERTTLFSRRMENLTDLFPEVAATVHESDLPVGTVLDTEFVVQEAGDVDNLQAAGSIMRCDSLRKAEMRKSVLDWKFLAFDLLYLDGNPVYRLPHRDRFAALRTMVATIDSDRIGTVETLQVPLVKAVAMVHENNWEGLVVWNADEGTVVQMNGKPKRTNCYKLKPVEEDDFVAIGYTMGNGRHSSVVGNLAIAQYRDGELVECGEVGTGFDDAGRAEALTWSRGVATKKPGVYLYEEPQVVQVKFAERLESGKLWHPVFLRRRTDKAPEECVRSES